MPAFVTSNGIQALKKAAQVLTSFETGLMITIYSLLENSSWPYQVANTSPVNYLFIYMDVVIDEGNWEYWKVLACCHTDEGAEAWH